MQNASQIDLADFFEDSLQEFLDQIGLDDIAYQRALKFYAEDLILFDSYEN